MPNYSWITFAQAKSALGDRLADPNATFWSDQEMGMYIVEALRTWGALTEVWNLNYAFTATSASTWYDLAIMPTSPRLRTVTDTDLYKIMEYHLLEPPTGGTWTGTSQFQISDLATALERRRDEIIQVAGCNVKQLRPIPQTPNTRRVTFGDSSLEPRRARFVPDSGLAVTLSREDTIAFDGFESAHLQTNRFPTAWSVITGPPLSMDVDTGPPVPGTYDVLSLQTGLSFAPPANTPVGVPNDWSWLAKWGALSDLLGRESEATDRARADYCVKRYTDGLKIMKASNWLVSATINGIPVDTPSVREMDGYAPEWQDNALAWPGIVTAGMDFLAVCPIPPTIAGVGLNLIQNAPVPVADGDFLQVARDVWDVILDYAQVLACFKMGGAEFFQTKDLEDNFWKYAMESNQRLAKLGPFSDVAHRQGKREDENQPR